MRICANHWKMMRDSVEAHGLMGLVHKDGESAMANELKALEGGTPDLDPLMSHNWHWCNSALANGGLYIMTVDEAARPENEGHYCPVCEYEKHMQGFVAEEAINSVSKQMQDYCIAQGLIPRPS